MSTNLITTGNTIAMSINLKWWLDRNRLWNSSHKRQNVACINYSHKPQKAIVCKLPMHELQTIECISTFQWRKHHATQIVLPAPDSWNVIGELVITPEEHINYNFTQNAYHYARFITADKSHVVTKEWCTLTEEDQRPWSRQNHGPNRLTWRLESR